MLLRGRRGGGVHSLADKDNYVISLLQNHKALSQRIFLLGVQTVMSRGYFRPQPEAWGGGARQEIRASRSSSQMTHSLPKSH